MAGTKSKPAHRVMDRVVIHNWHSIHQLGQPMLPERLAKLLTGDMRSLHDGILFMEKRLLQERDPTYPVIIAKVPDVERFGFVTTGVAAEIFLRFDDIFRMFHMQPLHPSIVRLVALSMAHQLCIEDTPVVAIMDPYYMQDIFMHDAKGRAKVSRYIKDFMVKHMSRKVMLMPYFPE